MAVTVSDNGVLAWVQGPLATIEQANTYATARQWSDWDDATEERRLAALLDASTYVYAVWTPPRYTNDVRDGTIVNAVIEAARLSLSAPLLGGNAAAEPQMIRRRVDKIEREWAKADAGKAQASRLALVATLLRAAGATRPGGVNVPIRRA